MPTGLALQVSPHPSQNRSSGEHLGEIDSRSGYQVITNVLLATRSILHGYGVRVDERDLSLHGGFKDELHASLGAAGKLPQVFVDGQHLGGADDVRRMHEAGELSKKLEACEMAPSGVGGGKGDVAAGLEGCSGCGGVRFVPCEECSGSCKVLLEELDSFRWCPECNKNGLMRCPLCCL